MAVRRTRALWAGLTALVLVVGGIVAPAMAEDPPLVWDALPGTADDVDGLSIGLETTLRASAPWDVGYVTVEPVPFIRPVAVNNSAVTRYVAFGIDVAEQGAIEDLWLPGTLGPLLDPGTAYVEGFFLALAPGESIADVSISLAAGVPRWPGRTYVMYEMSGPFESDPTRMEIARFTEGGRFVPVDVGDAGVESIPTLGQALEVDTALFPGAEATVAATGLVAGEELEVWLFRGVASMYVYTLGGGLLPSAVLVGADTVALDGTFTATISVPADTAIGIDNYQLMAGVPGERYWPANSHEPVSIAEPDDGEVQPTPTDGSPLTVGFELTDVTISFPDGTTDGTTSAAVTATGPTPDEFILFTDPPLFYQFDTSSTWPVGALVEVCITYDEVVFPGDPPDLYHYVDTPPVGYQWQKITSSATPGEVCGLTSSFSFFALGVALHDGSTVAPAKGELSDDNGHDTGLLDGDYAITMDLWWGENAGAVRLFEDGTQIAEQNLTRDTPNPQRAVFPITGKVNGTYMYTAELENSTGVTTTGSLIVKVVDANPGKPSLTATSAKTGAFTLTANMWWGTNATSAQFYEGALPVGDPIALTPNTPNAQSALLALVRPKGDYVYRVAFTNAAGTTWSDTQKVKVK
jgi:hypothetical protein